MGVEASLGLSLFIFAATTVPFLLVAAGLGWVALRGRRQVKASQNWMESSGHVLSASVEMRRSRSGTC